jgi:hypothetical protein
MWFWNWSGSRVVGKRCVVALRSISLSLAHSIVHQQDRAKHGKQNENATTNLSFERATRMRVLVVNNYDTIQCFVRHCCACCGQLDRVKQIRVRIGFARVFVANKARKYSKE